jgi:hypothetical protein
MPWIKTIKMAIAVLPVLVALSSAAYAQDQGAAAIREKLESEYQLTKTTDDKSDIVTAGSVLVLHKDKVFMVAASRKDNPCMNTYRDGKITPGRACKASFRRAPGFEAYGRIERVPKVPTTRNFVSGEKFWVTKIDVRATG